MPVEFISYLLSDQAQSSTQMAQKNLEPGEKEKKKRKRKKEKRKN